MYRIKVDPVNATKGYRWEGYTEDLPDDTTLGDIYRHSMEEFGRCQSKMHYDPNGEQCGWVFVKRMKYDDCNDTYLQETWVTVYQVTPEIRRYAQF